jgi:hypothetical protein
MFGIKQSMCLKNYAKMQLLGLDSLSVEIQDALPTQTFLHHSLAAFCPTGATAQFKFLYFAPHIGCMQKFSIWVAYRELGQPQVAPVGMGLTEALGKPLVSGPRSAHPAALWGLSRWPWCVRLGISTTRARVKGIEPV